MRYGGSFCAWCCNSSCKCTQESIRKQFEEKYFTKPELCNHYHEVPNICPCAANCGCRLEICKNIPGKQYLTIDDLQDIEYSKEKKMDDGFPRHLSAEQCRDLWEADRQKAIQEDRKGLSRIPGTTQKCLRCGKLVGSLEYHDDRICDNYRTHKQVMKSVEQGAFAGALMNERDKEEMTDEDLAKVFFNYVTNYGIPRIPEGKYGSGEAIGFDDLTLRQIREMADFVREMRK